MTKLITLNRFNYFIYPSSLNFLDDVSFLLLNPLYLNCMVVMHVLSPSNVEISDVVFFPSWVMVTLNVSSRGSHKSINPLASVCCFSSRMTSPDEFSICRSEERRVGKEGTIRLSLCH